MTEHAERAAGREAPAPRDHHIRGGAGVRSGGAMTWVWVAAILLLVFWMTLATALRMNHGTLVYALDDTYVHMAMAKNFAAHGVWGITSYGFTHSSSSPLWTLLLSAAFRLFGPSETLPLVLNLVLALVFIYTTYRILRARLAAAPPWSLFGLLLAVVFFTPLSPMVFVGQEHTLHLLAALVFAHLAARRIAPPEIGLPRPERIGFWLLVPLLAAIRYESLFLVLPVCILLAVRRRWREAALLGGLSILPIVLYGGIALAHGWGFFPNSVLLKANLPGGGIGHTISTITGYIALQRLVGCPHLLVLTAAALLFFALRRGQAVGEGSRSWLFLFLVATGLHLTLADLDWFYRYEAYLVALGVVAVGGAAIELLGRGGESPLGDWRRFPRWLALGALALIFAVALADRGARALLETPDAMTEIGQQQYQMGRFLAEYYPGASVALNDIGAADFLADIHCVDLMGLASMDVARAIRSGAFDLDAREALLREHGVRIAVVYKAWFIRPPTWIPCGEWTIRHHVVVGDITVTFFALEESAVEPLIRNLREFAPRLPPEVIQSGRYVEGL
jgi:hypothetical protein